MAEEAIKNWGKVVEFFDENWESSFVGEAKHGQIHAYQQYPEAKSINHLS